VIPHVAISSDGPDEAVEEKGKRLLFFGRIWEYKGLEYLIRAEPLISCARSRRRDRDRGAGRGLRKVSSNDGEPEPVRDRQ
jgi:hypothetical protein